MTSTLGELCKYLEGCAEKLEEEIKININDCHNLVTSHQMTDVKLALEKAKDYHYKEIVHLLAEIITNIRKVIFHEEKVKRISKRENLSEEEIKGYSYVQRQVNAFSGGEQVTRREKRRVTSEVSVYSLEAWERYLNNKEFEQSTITSSTSLPNISIIPKRNTQEKSKRKQKKFISSTFNNILDENLYSGNLDLLPVEANEIYKKKSSNHIENIIEEENEESGIGDGLLEVRSDGCVEELNGECQDFEESTESKEDHNAKYPLLELIQSLSQEHLPEPSETKPKIVDVVYKKKT